MDKLSEIIGKNLADLLEVRAMTQKEFSEKAGVDQSGVGKYIKGSLSVGTRTLERMAETLNVPVFYLLMTPEDRARWDSLKDTSVDQRLHESLRRLNKHQKEALLLAMTAMISGADSGNRDNS